RPRGLPRGYFPVAWARACVSAVSWATCQSWNDAPAGVSVSVIVVTGIPAVLASVTWAWMSGVVFWLLYTYTLICLVLIWASMVALSAAVGSAPSLIALRKPGGVSRFRPNAGDSIAKIDSEAATGVPAELVLIWLI